MNLTDENKELAGNGSADTVNTTDIEQFLGSPELFLCLCRDLVGKLDERRNGSQFEEKEKQLIEISRTIERLLEFAFIFQCDGVSASSIQEIVGCNSKTAKDLQQEIAHLEPWQAITRSEVKTEEYVKFTAESFYRNH